MEILFNNNNFAHQVLKRGNHYVYLVKWSNIASLCSKWSGNRECNKERVKELIKTYKNEPGDVDIIIHLAEVNDGEEDSNNKLVCYDGNHRRLMLNEIIKEDPELVVLVDIMFNACPLEISKCFLNINSAVQVSEIYFEEEDISLKAKPEILELVRKYSKKYKIFCSVSDRCLAPNFNPDKFATNILDIYKAYKGNLTVKQIEEVLIKLNECYSTGKIDIPKITTRTLNKCKKNDFWLFSNKYIPLEHIQKVLSY